MTSRFEDYQENDGQLVGSALPLRQCQLSYKLAQLDFFTPLRHASAGGAVGVYAIECAMDELAMRSASIRSSCV